MADQELLRTISTQRAKGKSDEEIRTELVNAKWSAPDINGAFALAELEKNPRSLIGRHEESLAVVHGGRSGLDWLLVLFVVLSLSGGYILYAYGATIRHTTTSAIATWLGTTTPSTQAPFIPFNTLPSLETAYQAVSTVQNTNYQAPRSSSFSNPFVAEQQPVSAPSVSSPSITITEPRVTSAGAEIPAPAVTITASASKVSLGTPVTLTWNATNATTCRASTGFSTRSQSSGSAEVKPTLSTSYTLTCNGEGGTSKASTFVTVVRDGVAYTPPASPSPSPSPTPSPSPSPSPSPTPGPSAPPFVPPGPSPTGSYPVYPGCAVPATSYARIVYVDPVNGSDTGTGAAGAAFKSLQTAVSGKKILPGDHIVLLPGNHGKLYADGTYGHPQLKDATAWTWLDVREGAVMESIEFRNRVARWLITNGEFTYPAGGKTLLAFTSLSHDIVVADSKIYTEKNTAGWDAAKWIGAAGGIGGDNAICLAFLRNYVTNVRHGIFVSTRVGSTDPAANSIKALIQDNVIKNFSADGMRAIASDVTIYHNSIIDEHVSAADGDGNHDDGIQGYALNGAVYRNLVIDHNWIQESTNPSRKWNASMQGISSFDGVYTGVSITNNVVLSSAYHGISWYGVKNTVIDHNTVANPTDNGHKLWIYIPVGKGGVNLPENDTISNNVAQHFGAAAGVTLTNNVTLTLAQNVLAYKAFDPANNNFDLSPKPGGPLDGKGVGANITRPFALAPGSVHRFADGTDAAVPSANQLAAVDEAFDDQGRSMAGTLREQFFAVLAMFWDWLFSFMPAGK